MSNQIQTRTDCEQFQPKKTILDFGDCQTDGHYLCAGCKHIAPFESMELPDNRMRYYKHSEINQRINDDTAILETKNDYPKTFDLSDEDIIDFFGIEDDEPEFERCSNCDGHDACEDFGCAIKTGVCKEPEW